jgi:hypothetical protein
MIPFLVKEKLALTYGQNFTLPAHIDLLLPFEHAYKGDEHDLQKSFFVWISQYVLQSPNLILAHAIPNGGTRDKITAGRLKAEGVKAGIPDVNIPIPSGNYNGMFIEFKVKRNKPTEDQKIMMLMLDSQGYRVICVNDLETAKKEFEMYMYGQ